MAAYQGIRFRMRGPKLASVVRASGLMFGEVVEVLLDTTQPEGAGFQVFLDSAPPAKLAAYAIEAHAGLVPVLER